MILSDEQLIELLVAKKKIKQESVEELVAKAKELHKTLYQYLVDESVVVDADLGEIIAEHLKLPFIDLEKQEVPEQIINTIPQEVAKRRRTVCYGRDEKTGVQVATDDVENNKIFAQLLSQKTGLPVNMAFATPYAIDKALLQYTIDYQKVFERFLSEDDGSVIRTVSHDPPVKKLVDKLITTAYEEGASDIHVEPREKDFLVRFRIDGILHDIFTLPKNLHDRVVTRIKVLSGLRTDQHMAAQDGKMTMIIEEERLDLRISIIPIAEGEKVVARLLTSKARSYTLSDLGFSEKALATIERAYKRSFGMVLSTGPTGSGKTTTIYSILKNINTRDKNLTSVEDPIEYRMPGANQVQVNPKTDLTFAKGLRSLLRQDPDIIFVGEIRDNETAGIAVNAALTGHLVLSTLHTNNAATTIPRLTDMKVEPFLVASTVNLIIGQRLVRKICPNCRVSKTITVKELQKWLSLETIEKHYIPVGKKKEVRIYEGQGCRVCHHTGYLGRIGIYELLEVTPEIREMISNKADADEINSAAIEAGMVTMFDDGIEKITKGLTTVEEVLRVTKTEDVEG